MLGMLLAGYPHLAQHQQAIHFLSNYTGYVRDSFKGTVGYFTIVPIGSRWYQ